LGLCYKDKINTSAISHGNQLLELCNSPHNYKPDENTTNHERLKAKYRGLSQDFGTLPNIQYGNMNFNRFDYLYQFNQKDNGKEASHSMVVSPNKPNVGKSDIINNPCIFKIREKLMSEKTPEVINYALKY
jgi:hypothetical protein